LGFAVAAMHSADLAFLIIAPIGFVLVLAPFMVHFKAFNAGPRTRKTKEPVHSNPETQRRVI
jgi:hypothetical protein